MAAVIDRVYAGGAVQAIVQGTMTPTVPGVGGTFTVDDATGYPSVGKFPVKLNRGSSDEEHILISSRVGTTFTIGQRGYDGTNAQAHDHPNCEIYWDAESANKVVDHVDGGEIDPHATTLLNNARHDTPTRHVYGASAAFGTRPVPASVGTANAAGSGSNPAAGDHVHDIANGAIDNAALFAAGVVNQAALANLSVGTAQLIDANVTQAKLATGLYVPIGGITMWGTGAAPTNWQLLDGSAISRTTFAALFALWGVTFGAGNGSTTFNVPDARQRFILGKATSGTGLNIGDTGGTIDHTHPLDGANAVAMIDGQSSGNISPQWRRKSGVTSWTANISSSGGPNAQAGSNAFTAGTQLQGLTDTANPPYLTLNFIVRTL